MTTQTDQAFLSFMIGSPQAFIEGARTLRDLWSGSYLVSWLTASAMRPLLDELGANCFVTPHVDPQGNHLVRAVLGRPSENDLATLPSIPNKFAALVPGERAEHLRDACLNAAQTAWKAICDAVHAALEKELPHNFSGWDSRWSDQVDSIFEFFAVVKPIHRSLKEYWNDEWDELGALTEMLRSVKHVPAYTHVNGRVPSKCSLLGSYEQMGPADLRESRQFWETAARRAAIRGTRLQKVDRLCAVSLVKRFAWPVALSNSAGQPSGSSRFSAICRMNLQRVPNSPATCAFTMPGRSSGQDCWSTSSIITIQTTTKGAMLPAIGKLLTRSTSLPSPEDASLSSHSPPGDMTPTRRCCRTPRRRSRPPCAKMGPEPKRPLATAGSSRPTIRRLQRRHERLRADAGHCGWNLRHSLPVPLKNKPIAICVRRRFVDNCALGGGCSMPDSSPWPNFANAPVVDQQFQAALWLLTHFGGIGSKGREGFGSLRVDGDLAIQSLEQALAAGATLRSQLGLGNDFDASLAESPALAHPGVCIGEYSVAVGSGRQAIEIAGRAYAEVAAAFKHDPDKIALGLPRKIHGPTNQPLRHQNAANHRRPEFLTTTKQAQGKPQDARYAAPVHLHVSEMSPGKWVVRLLALPVKYLPDAMSQAGTASFLAEFVSRFGQVIKATRQPAPPRNNEPPPPPPRAVQGFDRVEVKILEVKQVGNKHQLKVQEAGKPKPGMLVDGTSPDQLPDIGATVTVYRSTTSDINSPRYRWTPPEASGRDKKRLRR